MSDSPSRLPRLPDFVIVGAAKAGTTSLYALLDRHPQIFMPRVKEPEFFARDDRYAAGIDSYAAAFAAARPDQVVGEASTIYSLAPFFPETAARLARHAPDAKLVYVLREPVSRAYSFYVQLIKNYQNVTGDLAVHRSFEEFVLPEARAGAAPREKVLSRANAHLPDDPDLCLAGSDYLAQIAAWRRHFPRERMLFLLFEDFVSDPEGTLATITDFLGVGRLDPAVFAEPGSLRNVSRRHFETVSGMRAAQAMAGRLGRIWALRRLLPEGLRRRLLAAMARRSADQGHEPPRMRPETRARLQARFAPDRARLAEITGLDLSRWG